MWYLVPPRSKSFSSSSEWVDLSQQSDQVGIAWVFHDVTGIPLQFLPNHFSHVKTHYDSQSKMMTTISTAIATEMPIIYKNIGASNTPTAISTFGLFMVIYPQQYLQKMHDIQKMSSSPVHELHSHSYYYLSTLPNTAHAEDTHTHYKYYTCRYYIVQHGRKYSMYHMWIIIQSSTTNQLGGILLHILLS